MKKRVFEILEKGESGDRWSRVFDIFLVSLISLNVLAIILESVESLDIAFRLGFRIFEIISVLIFTIEYVLRVWIADLKVKSKTALGARIRYIFTPMALIDLIAILPFYLPFLFVFDLRFVRILRLTRLLRILKIQRYSQALTLIGKVLRQKKEELIVTIFVTFLLILFASTLMFYIEGDVQPDEFPNIIRAFWWAIATLTTIGYGDVYPLTGWGRFLSAIIAVLGIGLVALPTGIISSGFVEELSRRRKGTPAASGESRHRYCPYCGKRLDRDEQG